MKAYRYLYLFFSVFFLSVSAGAVTFSNLNPDYLIKYYNQNVQASCSLAPYQILEVYKGPSVPANYADCFVLDNSNASDIKYILKLGSNCAPEVIHPKITSAASNMCPKAAAAAGSAPKAGASSSTLQNVAALAPVAIAAATAFNGLKDKSKSSSAASPAARVAGAPAPAAAQVAGASSAGATNTSSAVFAGSPAPGSAGTGVSANTSTSTPSAGKDIDGKDIVGPPTPEQFAEFNKQHGEALDLTKSDLPPALLTPAKSVLNKDGASVIDQTAATRLAAEKASVEKFQASFTETAISLHGLCPAQSAAIKAAGEKYVQSRSTCGDDSSRADNLCSLIRNPTVQAVQSMMTLATPIIASMSGASQTCGSTSDITKIASTGMTLANMTCSGMKFKCDFSCKGASTNLKEIDSQILTLNDCMVNLSMDAFSRPNVAVVRAKITQLQTLIISEVTPIAENTAQCEKHSVSIVQMATQAAGLLMAAQQAKDCQKKLTAGGGSGPTVTMDEMCKDPAQATTLICKCKSDQTVAGCPGAVVQTKIDNNGPLVIKGNGSGSQMAGIQGYKQGSGLSPAAQAALGMDANSANYAENRDLNKSADAFAATAPAGATSGGNGAGLGSAATDSAGKNKLDSKADSKLNFGSFGSIGNAIGNFFGSGAKKSSAGGRFGTEQQIAAAKRQIASEQFRSEVSTASGRSNWDKVRTRYVESNSSFLGN